MSDMMTNFTAADMPGAKKPVAKKAAPAPKFKKVEAPVAAPVVEEVAVVEEEVVVELPAEDDK